MLPQKSCMQFECFDTCHIAIRYAHQRRGVGLVGPIHTQARIQSTCSVAEIDSDSTLYWERFRTQCVRPYRYNSSRTIFGPEAIIQLKSRPTTCGGRPLRWCPLHSDFEIFVIYTASSPYVIGLGFFMGNDIAFGGWGGRREVVRA